MPKAPTNQDIVKLITVNHEEVQSRLSAVEDQVKLTNGRVKRLETINERTEAVEEYKKLQGAQQGSNPKLPDGWDWKVVLGIILTLATIFAGVTAK